jgi:general secretion pathway protein G
MLLFPVCSKQKDEKSAKEKGMTLLEIIIVVALLGTLMTILVRNLQTSSDNAKVGQAQIGMANLEQALQLYRVHNNKYPSTAEGLGALISAPANSKRWRGPYTETNKLKDPWDNDYQYTSDGNKFQIISNGPDMAPGTADDIKYHEDDAPQGGASEAAPE